MAAKDHLVSQAIGESRRHILQNWESADVPPPSSPVSIDAGELSDDDNSSVEPIGPDLASQLSDNGDEDKGEKYEEDLSRKSQLKKEWDQYRATVEDAEETGAGHADLGGESDPLSRPSEYLRSRCPLCFGSVNWHDPESV